MIRSNTVKNSIFIFKSLITAIRALGDLHHFQNLKAVSFPIRKSLNSFLWNFSADSGCRKSRVLTISLLRTLFLGASEEYTWFPFLTVSVWQYREKAYVGWLHPSEGLYNAADLEIFLLFQQCYAMLF